MNYDKEFFNKSYDLKDKLRIKKISTDRKYKIKFAKKVMNTYINTKRIKKVFFIRKDLYLLTNI